MDDGTRYDRQHLYVNFGLLRHYLPQHLDELCLDTWYFSGGELLTLVDLGKHTLESDHGARAFLTDHVAAFLAASVPLLRVTGTMSILYKERVSSIRTFISTTDTTLFPQKRPEDLLWNALAEVPHLIVGVFLRLDTWIALRTFEQDRYEMWLPQSAQLAIQADRPRGATTATIFPWQAKLELSVASVFREDNHVILNQVRTLWHELREKSPGVSEIPEEFDLDPIITLAEPPAQLPDSNHDLWSINAPRLQSALDQWEQQIAR